MGKWSRQNFLPSWGQPQASLCFIPIPLCQLPIPRKPSYLGPPVSTLDLCSGRWFSLSSLFSTTASPVSCAALCPPASRCFSSYTTSLHSLGTLPTLGVGPAFLFSVDPQTSHLGHPYSFVSAPNTQKRSTQDPQRPHLAGAQVQVCESK